MKNKKVAIIHDWLCVIGGAEIVLKYLLEMFPQADLYTMIDTLSPKKREWIGQHKIYTSCLQKNTWAREHYTYFIPLMPYLVEQFDLEAYDMVISSSHAIAKGVIVHPHQTHISYIYSPMRYAWDLMYEHERAGIFGKGIVKFFMKRWLHKMRLWDFVSAQRPDILLADSKFIQQRIRKYWARESVVVYPPVEFDASIFEETKDEYYVTLSRLVYYKRIDLIIEAFNEMPEKKLIVIGDGVLAKALKQLARSNIVFKGHLTKEEAMRYVSKAKAFIFMAKEDFGIAPLEASACGTPVIAYGRGGARETIVENETGIFVDEQTKDSLKSTIYSFEKCHIDPYKCRQNALNFSVNAFKQNFTFHTTPKDNE